MSGLQVNPSKSTIILSKAVQRDRQAILDLMEFQEGSLPIKYLGVPLIASRLTVADCKPLLDKINSKLAGWSQLNLSLAGRTQLIKSVLSALHIYWASVFILPKSIINVIEGRMRKFLWQGSSGTGYAKVSWVQEDSQSIWVAWVMTHRLRTHTIWTYNSFSASWCWKKLVKISVMIKDGLEYRVGDGRKFKLWSDIWHPRGPLIHSFPRGSTITGLPSDSLLVTVMQQGQWRWPSEADFDIQEIIAVLPNIFPQQSDSIRWRTNTGGKFKIPWHDFILWLAILERLSTMDRPWVQHPDWPNLGWQRDILWASRRWRGKHFLNAAARALLASIVYNIWRECNNRRFNTTASQAESLAMRLPKKSVDNFPNMASHRIKQYRGILKAPTSSEEKPTLGPGGRKILIMDTGAGDVRATGEAGNEWTQVMPRIIPKREIHPIPNTVLNGEQHNAEFKQLSPTPRPCLLTSCPGSLVSEAILENPVHPDRILFTPDNVPEVLTHKGLIEGLNISQF
ncbi:UNVERIFIED_CONTAM: hypothetical protein Slati_2456000 [Sesamum latifolium]|uniref:Uncharacterized protein n=1 Tax=Sesamum latifolium TaxID=2727402 RepID=A0AAW2WEH2_9LAMI